MQPFMHSPVPANPVTILFPPHPAADLLWVDPAYVAIVAINGWNRLAIGFAVPPDIKPESEDH